MDAVASPESKEHNQNLSVRNNVMLAVTGARLGLLPELVDAIQDHSLARTAALVGAVTIADLADGMVARKLEVDTNSRRIADAVVDRITIWSAFGAAVHTDPSLLAWYTPLAVRGAVIATGSNLCFWTKNKLVLGGNFHKLASLSQAALGISMVGEARPAIMATVAAGTYAINAVSGIDYFGGQMQQLKKPRSDKLERIRVRKLEGLRSLLRRTESRSISPY